ncbi:MAG: hypothetical protein M3063_04985 [Actinomycetota bacterium]|nr:hypothetical protein [Actinomycetota bacterium]
MSEADLILLGKVVSVHRAFAGLRRAAQRSPARVRRVAGCLVRITVLAGVVVGLTPIAALAVGTSGGEATSSAPTLPLLRWANAVATIHTHNGVGAAIGPGDPFLTSLAGLLFQVSALVWQVLGSLVTAAQGTDAVSVALQQVNPIFGKIGDALLGTTGATSIAVAVIIVASGMVAGQAYRRGSGVSGALRGLAGVVAPVALLVVTVHAATGTGSGMVAARGSPSWAVQTVTGWTNSLSGSVAHLNEELHPVGTGRTRAAQGTTTADCAKYVDGLDNLYAADNATPGTGPRSLQVADSIALSHIWQSAVMVPWIDAQFGTGALGDKVFCHLLEIQANVSAADQIAAMAADVPGGPHSATSGPTWSQLVAGQPYVDPANPTFVPLLGPDFANGDDDLRRNMVAWATCDYQGGDPGLHGTGWHIDPAFAKVFTDPPTPETCPTWWAKADTKPPPRGGTLTTNGPFDFEDANAIHAATTAGGHDSVAARSYIQNLNGHNAGMALSTSLMAFLSSMTYAWSLGGLALGVLIGKLSLIIGVACSPIFLLLAAIPSATTRRAASKAFGLTFAALLSTFTFSVLMGLLLLFIGVLQDVAMSLFRGGGAVPGLVEGLVPLAALYVLRKLLRPVGMHSITSVRGAITTTAAFGQMGAKAGEPSGLRSRLHQVADLTTAADPLRGRRSAGSRPCEFDAGRPTMPDPPRPPTAAPLPWNRAWQDLLNTRSPAAPRSPLPPPPSLRSLRPSPARPTIPPGPTTAGGPSIVGSTAVGPTAVGPTAVGPTPRGAAVLLAGPPPPAALPSGPDNADGAVEARQALWVPPSV